MILVVNGVQYSNFVSSECNIRLDSLCNDFSFEATLPEGVSLPFKGGEPCEVYIDGNKVITGSIEVITVEYDAGGHTISIMGRDKTADLLDSSINAMDDVRADGLTLKSLIQKVISHLGLSINVVDEVGPKAFNQAEDLAAPEPGMNAFEFIEKYSRKRQVLLTSDGDGNIVITSNRGIIAEGVIQHIVGADDNNVIRSSFSYDITGRYNSYVMVSGLNPITLNQAGETDLASLVAQGGGIYDQEIRKGRQLVLKAESPFAVFDCKARAKWEADIRRARGLMYTAQLQGHQVGGFEGDIWRINRVYQIVDDFVGKVEPMLCNSISFTYDVDSGNKSSLTFVGQKAYIQFIEPNPIVQEATNVS